MDGLIGDRTVGGVALTRLAPGDASILERCWSGELAVLPGFVQKLGLCSLISPVIRTAVRRVAGEDAANALDQAGYASIHRILTAGQLRAVVQRAEQGLTWAAPELNHKTCALGLGVKSPLWVLRAPLLRFHFPFDAARTQGENDPAFSGRFALGRLRSLRPHRDSWFAEPSDCINIWIALTPVIQGNGMSFYPSTDGKALRFQANQGVAREQAVGAPLNFEIEAGDALVFHAEKLHASELNRTDQTRSVLSLRVGLAHPRLSAREPWRYMRIRPQSRLSCARLHPAYSIVTRKLAAAKAKLAGHRWSSADTESSCPENAVSGARTLSEWIELPLDELNPGQLLPVSKTLCVARSGSGEVYRFRRSCPHQGADLSLGRVVDGRVFCPWHNLPFDLSSGRSPCKTLPGLNPRRCEIRGNLVRIECGETANGSVDGV